MSIHAKGKIMNTATKELMRFLVVATLGGVLGVCAAGLYFAFEIIECVDDVKCSNLTPADYFAAHELASICMLGMIMLAAMFVSALFVWLRRSRQLGLRQ